jgi:hypothetical protein
VGPRPPQLVAGVRLAVRGRGGLLGLRAGPWSTRPVRAALRFLPAAGAAAGRRRDGRGVLVQLVPADLSAKASFSSASRGQCRGSARCRHDTADDTAGDTGSAALASVSRSRRRSSCAASLWRKSRVRLPTGSPRRPCS